MFSDIIINKRNMKYEKAREIMLDSISRSEKVNAKEIAEELNVSVQMSRIYVKKFLEELKILVK
jgi:predicted transcriptional regulator